MTITSLERRLARIDGGGDHGRVEDMSDAQLARIIRRGLPPAERKAYDAGTPAERDAILDAFIDSISSIRPIEPVGRQPEDQAPTQEVR